MTEPRELTPRQISNNRKAETIKQIVEATEFQPSDMPRCEYKSLIKWTPEDAKRFLMDNVYEYQRDTTSTHLLDLSMKMVDGRFTDAPVVTATFNGDRYVANGQHVAHACIIANKIIEVVRSHYECDTIEQLTCLWNQFDTGRVRTAKQMAASYVGVMGPEWTAESVSTFASACAMMDFGIEGAYSSSNLLTKEGRLQLLKKHTKTANIARELIYPKGEKAPHMAKAPVASVVLRSICENEQGAIDFWTMVRTGLGPEMTNVHPAYTLREYLMTTSRSRLTLARDKDYESSVTMAAKCWRAWEAFKDGKSLTKLMPPRKKKTIAKAA